MEFLTVTNNISTSFNSICRYFASIWGFHESMHAWVYYPTVRLFFEEVSLCLYEFLLMEFYCISCSKTLSWITLEDILGIFYILNRVVSSVKVEMWISGFIVSLNINSFSKKKYSVINFEVPYIKKKHWKFKLNGKCMLFGIYFLNIISF